MSKKLGDRMKSQYEVRTCYMLPRRTYTIVRLAGRAFHKYTEKLERPFDKQFISDMCGTAQTLCEEVQGVEFAYVQSDEISLLLTDFALDETQAFFNGNIQKIVSITASIATAKFNQLRKNNVITQGKLAHFDSRVFTIPDPIEVENYFLWRQRDCENNSLNMFAQSFFSHKQLHQKSNSQKHEMLHEINQNWNNLEDYLKRGVMIQYRTSAWEVLPAIMMHKQREEFRKMIPKMVVS